MSSRRLARKIRFSFLALFFSSAFVAPMAASAYEVRVSVKFILNQNGNRPAMGSLNTNGELLQQVLRANSVLCTSGSSMRLVLSEIIDLGGLGGYANWPCSGTESLEYIAKLLPVTFRWRTNAINIYITGNSCSGKCSFYSDEVIILGQVALATTLIHEVGHYLGLYHTHGKTCDGNSSCASCTLDDDGLTDTLNDAPCWTRDMISNFNFGKPYAQLSTSQKAAVDRTFNNIMSYHSTRTVFTPQQVSRMNYYALVLRTKVTTINSSTPCFSLFDGVAPEELDPEELEAAAADEVPYERFDVPAEISARINPQAGDEFAGAAFLPGDVDESLKVDITDTIRILSFLYSGGEGPLCDDAADFDDDGGIDLTDAIGIISTILRGGETPRGLPVGYPTFDRTLDELGCAARLGDQAH
jgi:hypothetical protein